MEATENGTQKSHELRFSAQDKALILSGPLATRKGKAYTEAQKALFIRTAEIRGLHPLLDQIYAVLRWDSTDKANVMSIETSIDGQRSLCERPGDFEGLEGPFWCGEDGVWKDVWAEEGQPTAAKVGVWRTGFRSPCWGVARWDDYANPKTNAAWRPNGMGPHMLAKCAEALARRMAFPQECSRLYTGDEMGSRIAEVLRGEVCADDAAASEWEKSVDAEWVTEIEGADSLDTLDALGKSMEEANLATVLDEESLKALRRAYKVRRLELKQAEDDALMATAGGD
jgi:phage recombination protein Bet